MWSPTRLERVARSAWTAWVPRSRIRAITSRGSRDPATSRAIWISSPRSWFGSGANIQAETLPQVKGNVGPNPALPRRGREGDARRRALPGCEGEEGVRPTALGVLLEPLDDEAPGVVDRAQVVLRDLVRPIRVAEQDPALAVFGGGDIPGHGRPLPIGEVRQCRP